MNTQVEKAQIEIDFHNTVSLQGEALTKAKNAGASQRKDILEFFKKNPMGGYTATEIHFLLGFDKRGYAPTSCRRAMTDMKNEGDLIKTDEMVLGNYGVVNHKYILNTEKVY